MLLYHHKPLKAVILSITIMLSLGCEKEPDIRQYTVKRTVDYSAVANNGSQSPGMQAPNVKAERILAAIAPTPQRYWFIKMTGSSKGVEAQKEAFLNWLKSFELAANGEPSWEAPQSWSEKPGTQFRTASFSAGEGVELVDISVIGLPPSDIYENINRWRNQVGLKPLSNDELQKTIQSVQSKSGEMNWVDLDKNAPVTDVGVESKPETQPQPETPPQPQPQPKPETSDNTPKAGERMQGQQGFSAVLPEGWVPDEQLGTFRVASLSVKNGDNMAQITVIPLGGAAGGDSANVNRWRSQIGLQPQSDAQITATLKQVAIFGGEGKWVHIEPDEGGKQAILAAMVMHQGRNWFFKMTGDKGLVESQKDAFMQFVKSAKLDSTGGNQ